MVKFWPFTFIIMVVTLVVALAVLKEYYANGACEVMESVSLVSNVTDTGPTVVLELLVSAVDVFEVVFTITSMMGKFGIVMFTVTFFEVIIESSWG